MDDQMQKPKAERFFSDIDADTQQATEVESLCMNCGKNGITRLLLTSIPHFREVILMAFECPHCGWRNNEIQSGSSIAEQGVKIQCEIKTKEDLNRQIVKGEHATIRFEELDFEIPANTQKGLLNTVEGFLMKAMEDLGADQDARRQEYPEIAEKIDDLIQRMQDLTDGNSTFTITIDDPAGNSYIENPKAPLPDSQMRIRNYHRTDEQCVAIGLDPEAEHKLEEEEKQRMLDLREEVLSFPANCSQCHAPVECKMKMVDIPYFKEVVIMSTVCDTCGFKSNEVKAGGAVAEKGKRISLNVIDQEDLSRDILKSESCAMQIPEIELQLDNGTLGGKFTTIEGLLQNVYDELESRAPFSHGDSLMDEKAKKLRVFLDNLQKCIKLEMPFTIILDDPLGNSYLQNLYAPDPDPNMTTESYERSWEQNEFLGLNDMETNDEGTNENKE